MSLEIKSVDIGVTAEGDRDLVEVVAVRHVANPARERDLRIIYGWETSDDFTNTEVILAEMISSRRADTGEPVALDREEVRQVQQAVLQRLQKAVSGTGTT